MKNFLLAGLKENPSTKFHNVGISTRSETKWAFPNKPLFLTAIFQVNLG